MGGVAKSALDMYSKYIFPGYKDDQDKHLSRQQFFLLISYSASRH